MLVISIYLSIALLPSDFRRRPNISHALVLFLKIFYNGSHFFNKSGTPPVLIFVLGFSSWVLQILFSTIKLIVCAKHDK